MNYITRSTETIVALCTAQGPGALALIRMSGPASWDIVSRISTLKSGKELPSVASNTIHAADIYDTDQTFIDAVMIIALRGPRTFTGYDTIEITCHNNPFIIQSLIQLCVRHGARPAQPGEFSRQAYENKKIDLLQTEAINELISAQTHAALKKSLSQLTGSLSNQIAIIEDMLCKAIAWCQASFEFLDDEGDFYSEIADFLERISTTIQPILMGYAAQKQIRQGYRVALIGSVNAGKSSLFNLLIGANRAIVNAQAGTTRDSIESMVILDNTTITLIDTAGLRSTDDVIEQQGIERSYQEGHASDVILLIIDGSTTLTDQQEALYTDLLARYANKIILVQNKADIQHKHHSFFDKLSLEPVITSAHNPGHKSTLEKEIRKKIVLLSHNDQLPFLINKRHYEHLEALFQEISHIQQMLKNSGTTPHYELISEHLRSALEHISQMSGKTVSEKALDRVFKEFCVGK